MSPGDDLMHALSRDITTDMAHGDEVYNSIQKQKSKGFAETDW